MGEGVIGFRRKLGAALFGAAGLALLVTAPGAYGAPGLGEHSHDHDPSLSLNVGKENRFSKKVSVTGEVWMVEAYDPKSDYPYLKLLRTRDDRMYGLYGTEVNELEMGKRYKVSGLVDSNPASFQAVASADLLVSDAKPLRSPTRANRSAQLSETGSAGFIAAFVTWPGSRPTSFDRDVIEAQALGGTSLSASNGKFVWEPVTMVEVQLPEPLASCESPSGRAPVASWVGTVRAALEERGFNLRRDYRALGIAFPEGVSICYEGAWAYATYSDTCEWMEADGCGLSIYGYEGTNLRVLNHELGHTLGLPHANTMLCGGSNSPITVGYGVGCRNVEYGDRFDNMGSQGLVYNSAYLDRLGWLEATEVERIPFWKRSDLEVNLSSFAGNSGLRMIETGLPPVQAGGGTRSPGRLFVEYRTRTGLDAGLYPGPSGDALGLCPSGLQEGVYLRVVPNAFGGETLGLDNFDPVRLKTYLLDTNPQTVYDPMNWGAGTALALCDAGLQPGDSWEDPTGKLKIDFLSRATDLSSATIRVRSEGAQMDPPTLELEKVGEGRGKIVIEEAGIECEGKCTEVLEDEARITIRAVPGRGSVFGFWMGACGSAATNPTCSLVPEWGQKNVIRAGFESDPNFARPDIDLSAIQLTPMSLKVKAGKRARFSVQVTNTGLDEGDARVSLSSSAPSKAKVPGSVSFKVPGESTATGSFTVTTRKMQKGRVTITAKVGPHMSRASLVLTR